MHSPSVVKGTSMPSFRFTILRSAILFIGRETIEEMREMHPISGLKRETSCLGMAFTSESGGTDDAQVVSFRYRTPGVVSFGYRLVSFRYRRWLLMAVSPGNLRDFTVLSMRNRRSCLLDTVSCLLGTNWCHLETSRFIGISECLLVLVVAWFRYRTRSSSG